VPLRNYSLTLFDLYSYSSHSLHGGVLHRRFKPIQKAAAWSWQHVPTSKCYRRGGGHIASPRDTLLCVNVCVCICVVYTWMVYVYSLAVEPQYPQLCIRQSDVDKLAGWSSAPESVEMLGPMELSAILNSLPCSLTFTSDDHLTVIQTLVALVCSNGGSCCNVPCCVAARGTKQCCDPSVCLSVCFSLSHASSPKRCILGPWTYYRTLPGSWTHLSAQRGYMATGMAEMAVNPLTVPPQKHSLGGCTVGMPLIEMPLERDISFSMQYVVVDKPPCRLSARRCRLALQMLHIAWSVCVSVCLSVSSAHRELCRNGWTNYELVWDVELRSPQELYSILLQMCHGKQQFGRDVCCAGPCNDVAPNYCITHCSPEHRCIRCSSDFLFTILK